MNPIRRRTLLTLIGTAAAGAASIPFIAAAGPGAQAPNLRADPVENIIGPNVYSDTEAGLGDDRLLVRFDGFVTNVGNGPIEVSGNPQITDPNNTNGVRQRARATTGGPVNVIVGRPEVKFEAADSHNHWHLMRAMRYSLWNLDRTAEVAPGQKVGFCLYDIEGASGAGTVDPKTYDASVTLFCQAPNFGGGGPDATTLKMGTSPGWRDVYDQGLAYQWVDVSNTAPGTYLVASQADPDNVIWEGGGSGESNPPTFASQQVTVPGWVAQPVAVRQTGAPQAIALSSTKAGTQSNSLLRYRIVSPPANGTLNVATGAAITNGSVTYTPRPGYVGPDAFRYVAYASNSQFPITPVEATVTVADATPSVAISGAPASLVAGTSAQLSAQVSNLAGGVAWTATAGTVDANGLFKAPAAVPAGGTVTVRATSTANPGVAAQAVIAISPPPKTTARPDPFATLTAGRKPLSALRIKRFGPRVFVAKVVAGAKGGRVTFTVRHGRKVLATKTARVGARKGITYRVTVKRGIPVTKVKVTARFVTANGKTTVRTARVPAS